MAKKKKQKTWQDNDGATEEKDLLPETEDKSDAPEDGTAEDWLGDDEEALDEVEDDEE